MKHIKNALELLAVLEVFFLIYGVCGAYEQDCITFTQMIKYLILFGSALAVNVWIVKKLTAATETKNREFLRSERNRPKRLVMPVRFDYLIHHTILGAKCQHSENEQKRSVRRFSNK